MNTRGRWLAFLLLGGTIASAREVGFKVKPSAIQDAGKVKIAKLNIDENPQTPPKYGIRGIPTLMLFKDGNVEATKVGAVSKSQLTAFIDSNL